MTERPYPLALETYRGMLEHHSASIRRLNEIIANGGFTPDSGPVPERLLMEIALNAYRVASKLITAWQKDVASRAELEEAQRAAIAYRFRNMM